ncbi:uncharacterized protein LOC144130137 [Amblyomma americanum]
MHRFSLAAAVFLTLTPFMFEGGHMQPRRRVPPSWVKDYDDEKMYTYSFGMYHIEPNSFKIGNLANGEETYLCMVALEFLNNDTLLANKQLREVTHMPGYSSMESGLCRAFFLGPSQVLPPLTVVTASVFRHVLSTGVYSYYWEPLPPNFRSNQLVKFENFEEYFLYDDPNLQWRKSDLAVVVARIRYQNNELPGLQIYAEAERGNETFYVLLDERVVPVHQKNAVYATRRAHSG